jgi:hypothetical protein
MLLRASTMLDDATTRLYISPLTQDLLPVVLGQDLASVANNISYHDIQTFPEKGFGYVELPSAEAARLKKKLSGSILRGNKMKVEEAKPKKRRAEETEDAARTDDTPTSGKRSKERKDSHDGSIHGRELSPERKVRRGWTEPKKDKTSKKESKRAQKQQSKYTEEAELLFRTRVPANKVANTTTSSKKPKKTKHGAEEQTIHEFQNTTAQPSFLRSDALGNRTNLEYVDGKGWVDEAGEVVEGEPASVRRVKKKPRPRKQTEDEDDLQGRTATSLGGLSSSIESLESDSVEKSEPASNVPAEATVVERRAHRENARLGSSAEADEVHPLESLFKKPHKPASQDVAKPSLEISTGFSFFGPLDDIEDEAEVPLTPFSQDNRTRGLRSAAPTPDTAHPSRFNSYDSARYLEGEESDKADDAAEVAQEHSVSSPKRLRNSTKSAAEPSDFEKMFWEKRGDNNRAWKGRRRAVLKEKRHRENRARRPKNW